MHTSTARWAGAGGPGRPAALALVAWAGAMIAVLGIPDTPRRFQPERPTAPSALPVPGVFAAVAQGGRPDDGSTPGPMTGEPPVEVYQVEAVREEYRRSRDLYGLMHELLESASAGERAAQYYIYLVLGRCQTWLRMGPEEARDLNERMLLLMNERPAEERLQWESEYLQCRGFAGGDLGPLRAAMGEDTPGAEVEYASIWFQRALAAGYPPALAEAALRINLMSTAERRAALAEAAMSGDPDVYWQLFLNSPGEGEAAVGANGLAWLIVACGRGHDCSGNAEWFRGAVCLEEGQHCRSGYSALEHFWYALPAHERGAATAIARRIEHDLVAGRADRLPWPALAKRNIYANRFDDR